MRKFYFGLFAFANFAPDGVAGGDAGETPMASAGQPSLFPEDDDESDGDAGGLAGQLAALPPDQMSQLATAMEPDVRLNLAQALIAAMPDEDKLKLDTVPADDVGQTMNAAQANRPEEQYQMSVVRACKRMQSAGTYDVTAENELKGWRDRVESLHEDGYLTDDRKKEFLDALAASNETRFSILLTGRGSLSKVCTGVEMLEEARGCSASIGKSVLQTRFGGAKPANFPKKTDQEGQGGGDEFDRKAAEEAGSRLATMR
jgi:hypothetical protein